jgi:two-component system cell cycle sensor histidine kinase/response regulator CckA
MTPSSANPELSPNPPTEPWILVVDDEPSMRRLIDVVLKTQGWNVSCAEGAAEAMETLRTSPTSPSVVICDVLMPKVDGLELVRKMCAKVPNLNVIFISGHLTDVSWWPTDLREHRFLAKPFENRQLVAAVKDALGGEPLDA